MSKRGHSDAELSQRDTLEDHQDPPHWRQTLEAAVKVAEEDLHSAEHDGASIYTGEAGVVYAILRQLPRGAPLDIALVQKLNWLLARLQVCSDAVSKRRVSFLEGLPGILALQAAVHRRLGQEAAAKQHVVAVGDFMRQVDKLEVSECEVLYGRCGYLGAILFLRREFNDPGLLQQQALKVTADVIQAGQRSRHPGWSLYYTWHGKCYLGGAHGLAGIVFTLLQFPAEIASIPGAGALLRQVADELLAQRFPSGNMRSSLGSDRDRLVQWCHGATGLVPLMLLMAEVYNDPSYLEIARGFGEVVWQRGVLHGKGPGLCHGTPGNGYAFLALQRAAPAGDVRWLRRAKHFAVTSAGHVKDLMRNADSEYSLFEGLAGAYTFWNDVLHAEEQLPEASRFPCFEF